MKRISSNTTLALKLFVPVFWLVFYGSFTLAFWLTDTSVMPLFASLPFRLASTVFFIGGSLFLYYTFFQLKRVEIGPDFIFVSNYFKSYRFPFQQVEGLSQKNYLLFQTTRIHFDKNRSFGTSITFIARRGIWDELAEQYPEWMDRFTGEGKEV